MNRLILSLAALPLLAACAEPVEEPALQEASPALLSEPAASVAEASVAVVEPTLALSEISEAPTLREVIAVPQAEEFGAIGAAIQPMEGGFLVADVLEAMPAAEAGITPQSQVIAVDGVETAEMTMATFLSFVRGVAGEPVTLTVVSPEGETQDVTLEREPLVVEASYCDRVRQMRAQTEFGGIGVHVMQDGCGGDVVVRDVMEGLPAHAAGVLAGDRVVSVDGLDATGAGLNTVVLALRGQAGQPVTLGVMGADGAERTVTLERVDIATPAPDSCAR